MGRGEWRAEVRGGRGGRREEGGGIRGRIKRGGGKRGRSDMANSLTARPGRSTLRAERGPLVGDKGGEGRGRK